MNVLNAESLTSMLALVGVVIIIASLLSGVILYSGARRNTSFARQCGSPGSGIELTS